MIARRTREALEEIYAPEHLTIDTDLEAFCKECLGRPLPVKL